MNKRKQGKGKDDIEWPQDEDGDIDELGNGPPCQASQVHGETLDDEQDGGHVHDGCAQCVVAESRSRCGV